MSYDSNPEIISKYPSYCRVCGGYIEVGEKVWWVPGPKFGWGNQSRQTIDSEPAGTRHLDCQYRESKALAPLRECPNCGSPTSLELCRVCQREMSDNKDMLEGAEDESVVRDYYRNPDILPKMKGCTCTTCPRCHTPKMVCRECGVCARCSKMFPYHKKGCRGCPGEFEQNPAFKGYISAKFNNVCPVCRGSIRIGERIWYESSPTFACHANCRGKTPIMPTKTCKSCGRPTQGVYDLCGPCYYQQKGTSTTTSPVTATTPSSDKTVPWKTKPDRLPKPRYF